MWGFKKRIYLDYASATPVLQEAARAATRAAMAFANPGGLHAESVAAKGILADARERIAAQLACKAREIIFTSGLTEANNIAIVGYARQLEQKRRTLKETHWIVSSIEHSSVLECFAEVERMGGTVSHVDPEANGIVTAQKIAKTLSANTVFVSVGWGNNEIGTVQPLSAIARVIREHPIRDASRSNGAGEKTSRQKIIFHSDAGQAPLYFSPHVHTLGVDMLALGSGKLYGPRGVGALYVSNKVHLAPVLFGGGQERGLRSGTEDPALAAGFAAALDSVAGERDTESKRIQKLRDDFACEIVARIPDAVINGDLKHSLPHMLNVSIPGERNGEYLVLALDQAGVALSTKSACREGEANSHVVAALGGPEWRAKNTLRFSLGRDTTARDLKRTLDILAKVITAP